jgi:DNA-binding response OmpR family regulator
MAVILVVEDDPANAVLVQAVLNRDGHQVLLAADGVSALDVARRRLPDVVLLDVSLTGDLTGFDVCRALRAEPSTAATGILMLSGWAFDSDVEAGRAAGADGYIAKPFAAADLCSQIRQLLVRAPGSKPH